jgi:hypothetical protein
MNAKSLLIAGALTLASLGVASAKSYDVVLSAPAIAGATQLKPGEYKVKVQGSEAVFIDQQSSKSFSIPVKIENGSKKFGYTSIESTNNGGMDTIQSIDLADSNTRLVVGQ